MDKVSMEENNQQFSEGKNSEQIEKHGKGKVFSFVAGLVLVSFFFGMQVGSSDALPRSFIFSDSGRESAPEEVDWNLLWDAIDEIEKNYVNSPPDMLKVLYGAVRGAVASLEDPYSVFLPPREAEEFKNELSGNLEGIGAEIAIKNNQLTVVTPLDGSPAEEAGIRPGDFIYKVGDRETFDLTLEEAVMMIRGPAGSPVTLTVFHRGETDPEEITITRAQIVVKSVEAEIREHGGKQIGYIKLRRFGEGAAGLMEQAFSQILARDISGIILDLRNNPGGFLETSVEIAGNWVEAGDTVVIQRFGDGRDDIVFRSHGSGRLSAYPTVVLVNGGSASASEIVAGALRDHGLATLVGEKTFGKGSVQELINLNAEAQLKLTIAKWLTPSEHDLNKEGLEPDTAVELTDEDFENDRDPQLDRALEILNGSG